ncbi:MAG: hypothetical protein HPY83_16635 [Anaerolineae bacterium]|nr:hypothetical protein [Anaerolineae bacterium]
MPHFAEALIGWLIVMGMVLGGAGALLLVMSGARALALLVRRIRIAPPSSAEVAPVRRGEAATR